MTQTRDVARGVEADSERWIEPGERPEFDIPRHLAHATQQARERNFQDLLIVDVDAHHTESNLLAEMTPYIEDPVIRYWAKNGTNLVHSVAGMENVGGRIWPSTQGRSDRNRADVRGILQLRSNKEAMGIDQQIYFPTLMRTLGVLPDGDIEAALSWAYSRWITEKIIPQDPLLKSMLYLPLSNPEACVRAIEEFGDRPGVVGFMVTTPRYSAINHDKLMQVYTALEERGLPLAFHAANHPLERIWEGMNKFISSHSLGFVLYSWVHLMNLVVNGIPERFPKLKFLFIESGLAWIPFLMQRLDNEYGMRTSECPLLQKKPSEYMRENISYASQPLETSNLRALEMTMKMIHAETQLMYSSGYPSWDWNPPSAIYDLPFLSEPAKRRILGQNAAEFFNL
jgi:uncharacterized protein